MRGRGYGHSGQHRAEQAVRRLFRRIDWSILRPWFLAPRRPASAMRQAGDLERHILRDEDGAAADPAGVEVGEGVGGGVEGVGLGVQGDFAVLG
jgi:hypothetical protein